MESPMKISSHSTHSSSFIFIDVGITQGVIFASRKINVCHRNLVTFRNSMSAAFSTQLLLKWIGDFKTSDTKSALQYSATATKQLKLSVIYCTTTVSLTIKYT